MDYLIGEKIFSFVMAAERDPDFAAELPVFIAEIRRLFTAQEIHTYLDELERTKFLAPGELPGEHDPDDEAEEEPWPDNPVLGAQELLRFSRVRQLLQEERSRRSHHQLRSLIYASQPKAHAASGLVIGAGVRHPVESRRAPELRRLADAMRSWCQQLKHPP